MTLKWCCTIRTELYKL